MRECKGEVLKALRRQERFEFVLQHVQHHIVNVPSLLSGHLIA